MAKKSRTGGVDGKDPWTVTEISVAGFKSISDEMKIEIRPLTILAGANSSGKSSTMQPLLLLKQTLEATYDPGALLLNGPNVRFTSADQMLSRTGQNKRTKGFYVGMSSDFESILTINFDKHVGEGFKIQQMTFGTIADKKVIHTGMTNNEITSLLPPSLVEAISKINEANIKWVIGRRRCFLDIESIDEKS